MSIKTRIQRKLHQLVDRFSGEFSAGSEAVHPESQAPPAEPTLAPPPEEAPATRKARLRRPRGDAGISRR